MTKSNIRFAPRVDGIQTTTFDETFLGAMSAAINAAAGHLDDVVRLIADAERALAGAAPRTSLRVDADGRWFEVDGERIDCRKRPVMKRVVLALARASSASPPRALSAAELGQAGWPEERIRPESARNRLHVTLTRLRRSGLRGLLIGNDHGWAISPEVAITIVEDDYGARSAAVRG
jgi:hypothetical protein